MTARRTLLAAVLALAPTASVAQAIRRYDARGRYIGRSEARGDTTRHYDAQGRYTGRSERRGGEVREYDAAGRYLGRSAAPRGGGSGPRDRFPR
jgi:YD repeat-containing protein